MESNIRPIPPLREVINTFAKQSETQLEINYRTQHVWPTEVYPGYSAINEMRRRRKQWHSTGEGARSFSYVVNGANPDNIIVIFSFNDYLRYADLGVGQGVKADDVERQKKANFKRTYTSKWNRWHGRSHRPFLMMEMRHLQRRMEEHLVKFYQYKGEVWIGNIETSGDGKVKVKIQNA